MYVGLLIQGCAAPEGDSLPSAWVYAEDERDAAPLSVAEVEEALGEVLATVLRVDPILPIEAFSAARNHGDTACPVVTDHSNQDVVSGDCTANSGYTYLGYALINRMSEVEIEYEGERHYHHTFDWTTGLLRILGPDGHTLEILGDDLYREYLDDDGNVVLQMYLWGDFYADNGPEENTWLAQQVGVELHFSATRREDGNVGTWSGGLSRLQGVAKAAVLHDLAVDSTPEGCAMEGVGDVDLLAENGVWHTVHFDGAAACDGCGEVTVEGASIGEACIDTSGLSTWEERPWVP